MKAVITLTVTKTYTMDYDDNDYSDEVLTDNFWLWEFNDSEFLEAATLTLERKDIDEVTN